MPAIKHIAIAVQNVDAALRSYQDVLGVTEVQRHAFEQARSNEAHCMLGQVQIQLCQSRDADGRFARYLAERGDEDVHHICYAVDNIEQAIAGATARGAMLKPWRIVQDDRPVQALRGVGGLPRRQAHQHGDRVHASV
jgi:methylmalonyl-CoA/ethylmalonyl-CoA epimerase